MKRILQAIFALLASTASLTADFRLPDNGLYTSLTRLLAHPESYHGKQVFLKGHYRKNLEHSAVYLTAEDADYGNTQSGIWVGNTARSAVSGNVESIRSGYVQIMGTFHFDSKQGSGNRGLWPGQLDDIMILSRPPRSKEH